MGMEARRIVVVGGVAGGASAAARARRLCERCDILVLDRGPFVSFANCGLPYFVGNVIENEGDLLVASPELFRERFNIDVRTRHEVLSIDRDKQVLAVRDLVTGQAYEEPYTDLVLSPGARALRPPIPGIDLPGIFVLRTIPDSHRIRDWITQRDAKRAVVVGGGFIGLEMAENLRHRNLEVTLIELADQVLPPIDAEMATFVEDVLRQHGVGLHLGDGVKAFSRGVSSALEVQTQGGEKVPADLVILAIGVRPETKLAVDAGLLLGDRGGIRVDAHMRTSDPHIWAVGDAVEVQGFGTGAPALIPLAGPANRQGRIAADNIFGRGSTFRGVQGTAVCGMFGLVAAATGLSEKALRDIGDIDFETVYLHPGHHVGYYPGAKPIHLKLAFEVPSGRILGAQAVGESGAERRIDVIATAIQKGATVFDLEEAELCYAPQFGAAKDPVNLAGMIAANVLRNDMPLAHWGEVASSSALILDVRDRREVARGQVQNALNIPLAELRGRLGELREAVSGRDKEIWVYCGVGQRAYYATRLLLQEGFAVRNLSGGYATGERILAGPASTTSTDNV